MEFNFSEQIASELTVRSQQVVAAIRLLREGNTVPFIARYRKEATGELDEHALRSIAERFQYLQQLSERKEEVLRLIDEQDQLTQSLADQIRGATKLQEVEDLYRPYRPKRQTRASIAKERGLGPLAAQLKHVHDRDLLLVAAKAYVSTEKGVSTPDEAVDGACDIVAEELSDRADIRQWIRQTVWKEGAIRTEARDDSIESVYEMYYEYEEPVKSIRPHRILAINRGEKEGILRVHIEALDDNIKAHMQQKGFGATTEGTLWNEVAHDSYQRLIAPAIERDIRKTLTEKAEKQAIHIFSENLRKLLLQPPIHNHVVLGVDPAYRTGCKLSVVDETGKVLATDVCYPTPPHNKQAEAKQIFQRIIDQHGVSLIAIGNGTASRETERFVADVIRESPHRLYYVMVNEAGASVYSASKLASEEFPDLDVAERSAVSIARRLQDPLAELVKIDPKSVGVGQYQHDVSQKKLSENLKIVVESAVNHVGVDLNTASPSLLQYVAGLSATVSKNIVSYRETEGKFKQRNELKAVPRLGDKTYEQCAGFLRIASGDHPLDNTPIHPESYGYVEGLLDLLGADYELIGTELLNEELRRLNYTETAERLHCGVPTLKDIVEALKRPGRDPREELPAPILQSDILQLEDLREGMALKGTVRNVVDFGAFVDIGLENDALVHISKLRERFVRHPLDVVSVGDVVDVWVLNVDTRRQRVSLSMIPLT